MANKRSTTVTPMAAKPPKPDHLDELLDEAESESFPASDPIAVTPHRQPVQPTRHVASGAVALLFVFDSFENARAARDELIRTGISPECVRHEALEGEAGPAQGNFVVGSGRAPDGRPRDAITVGRDARYDANFSHVGTPSAQLLVVESSSERERAAACQLVVARGGRLR